jgi:hypothetical protein
MRIFFGMILGVALTVGTAFVSDNWMAGAPNGRVTTGAVSAMEHPHMVNWSVVDSNLRIVGHSIRDAWTRLSHKITS